MKLIRRILFGVAAPLVLAVIAALSYRAMLQHRIATEVRITSPNGVNEAAYIEINGAQEWITIRGEDRNKPAILFLHGGPSEANSPFVPLYRPFENDFVFVQWDQPGAGMTYIKAGNHQPTLTLDGMAADGIAVAEYVRNELHQPKIILIGQDWGGLLAIRMIEKRPELFTAFVGTGQIVGVFAAQLVQYEYALRHATASHDEKMLTALKRVGPPPYRTLEISGDFQNCCRNPFWPLDDIAGINRMRGLLVSSPNLSITEVSGWVKGLRTGEKELDTSLMGMGDLRDKDTKFSVPVFFIQGADDNVTPTSLVADYVSKIEAPVKNLDTIPGTGHFVMWTRPAEFLHALLNDLRSASERSRVSPIR